MRGGSARNRPYLSSDERVGILLVEGYKGKGDLSVRSVKRFIRANAIDGCEVLATVLFCDLFIILRQ